jgi:hypothetical protein
MSDLDDPGPRPDPTLPPALDPAVSPAGSHVPAPAASPAAEATARVDGQDQQPEPPGYAPPERYPVPPGYDPADYAPPGYPGPAYGGSGYGDSGYGSSGYGDEETSWPPVAPDPPAARREWPIRKRDLVWSAVWVMVPVVAGLVLAFVWHAMGPHVDIVMTAPDRPDLTDYNTEAFVAGDGRYAVLTGIAGIVTGALAWLLRRGRGPLLVVALAAGSLAGAYLTWKLGTHLGEAEYRRLLKTAAAGTHFSQNMQLRAEGLVYLQPLAAVAVFVGCAAWSRYPDLIPSARHEPLPAYPPPEYSENV